MGCQYKYNHETHILIRGHNFIQRTDAEVGNSCTSSNTRRFSPQLIAASTNWTTTASGFLSAIAPFALMEGPLPHHFAAQQLHDGNLFHAQQQHNQSTLVSQLDLDPSDPFQFSAQLDGHHALQHLQPRNAYEHRVPPPPRFHEIRSHVPSTPQDSSFHRRGQFGVLTPHSQLPSQPQAHQETLERLQNEIDLRPTSVPGGGTTEGHFSNLKIVPNPPNLKEWRKRLFDVDDLIRLTEDEYALIASDYVSSLKAGYRAGS